MVWLTRQARSAAVLLEPARPTRVFLLLLEDLFQYQFLYEALRAVAQEYLDPALSPQHIALRSYLGLHCDDDDHARALDAALGPLGSRDDAIQEAQIALRLHFSEEQLKVLRGLKDHVSIINCVAGSGKTQLMIALVAKFVLKPQVDDAVTVYLAAPTRRMVDELYQSIQSLQGADMSLVARLGVSNPDDLTVRDYGGKLDWDPDYFAAYVAGVAEAQCHYELDTLAAVDNAINLLSGSPPGCASWPI